MVMQIKLLVVVVARSLAVISRETPVEITTKISEVNPRKLGEP